MRVCVWKLDILKQIKNQSIYMKCGHYSGVRVIWRESFYVRVFEVSDQGIFKSEVAHHGWWHPEQLQVIRLRRSGTTHRPMR